MANFAPTPNKNAKKIKQMFKPDYVYQVNELFHLFGILLIEKKNIEITISIK